MSFRRALFAALLAVAFAPSAAQAAEVRVVARDVQLGAPDTAVRTLSARTAPLVFDLLGLHWRGSGRVWFRTARADGLWSAWQPAAAEAEDLPDRGTPEAGASGGWRLGSPYWTGPGTTRVQYRAEGRVLRLRAFFVSSPVDVTTLTAPRAGQPAIIRRSQWGADESIVRAAPSYARRLRLAVVHHTAGTNSYTRAQSAAIVRGIQRYHVLSNGWNDIGYNFLVDKYGQVFEGRGGGIARNVVGAHAQGFNTGSVGVAMLGTYGGSRISSAGRSALVRLLAWRLDVAHVDPASTLRFSSYGNERFAPGTAVRLRAVSGHRDTGYTSCPGTALYGQLGGIAASVAATGLPKLYDPRVNGSLGGPARFTARLSASVPWAVTVRDGAGAEVVQGTGWGSTVDWTWNSAAAAPDAYTYVISAGPDVRPATGRVPGPPPLGVLGSRARPAVFTPNGDGQAERTRISFSLTRRATVRVTVLASGTLVKTLLPDRDLPAGRAGISWNGTRDDGSPAADRRYRVRIAATAGAEQVVRFVDVLLDRTLGSLTATPEAFSPNRDGRLDEESFGFELSRDASVRVHVLRGKTPVRRLFAGAAAAGHVTVSWDGRLPDGSRPRDGAYGVRVQATTLFGTRTLVRRFRLDTTPPGVRVVSARVVDGVTRIVLRLSEPARLRIWYGTSRWYDGDSITVERPAGASQVWRHVRAGAIRIVARDSAGNAARAAYARVD